jgi:partner of Y14 and mago
MPPKTNSSSSSGIVVDSVTGQRHVPASVRTDGSTRREIRIRPGYQPPEDVEKYKNRTAEAWKNRGTAGVPGAELVGGDESGGDAIIGGNKNAKKREAKKRAKAVSAAETEEQALPGNGTGVLAEVTENGTTTTNVDSATAPEAEPEKKARNLKKKLRQARELRDKRDQGEQLLPEQLEKVIRINELIRQLDSLGFDADGEPKSVS